MMVEFELYNELTSTILMEIKEWKVKFVPSHTRQGYTKGWMWGIDSEILFNWFELTELVIIRCLAMYI